MHVRSQQLRLRRAPLPARLSLPLPPSPRRSLRDYAPSPTRPQPFSHLHNARAVKPLTTLVTFICVLTDTYGDYQIRPDVAFPYITFVDNASQARAYLGVEALSPSAPGRLPRSVALNRRSTAYFFPTRRCLTVVCVSRGPFHFSWRQVWAMYCLILVYINCHDEIAGLKPAVKFLCVKGVVFATFWQNSLLSLLAFVGSLDGINWNRKCSHASSDSVVMSLQNFLISVEMLIFAVLHAYAFPSREYRDATVPPRRAAARLKALLDVSDVYDDVRGHAETVADQVVGGVRDVGGLVAGKARRRPAAAAPISRDSSDRLLRAATRLRERPRALTALPLHCVSVSACPQMNHVADHVIRVGGRRKRRSGGSRDLLNEPLLEGARPALPQRAGSRIRLEREDPAFARVVGPSSPLPTHPRLSPVFSCRGGHFRRGRAG